MPFTSRYGGLYVDLDFECLKSIDTLLELHRGALLGQMGHDRNAKDSLPYVVVGCWRLTLVPQRGMAGKRSRARILDACSTFGTHCLASNAPARYACV